MTKVEAEYREVRLWCRDLVKQYGAERIMRGEIAPSAGTEHETAKSLTGVARMIEAEIKDTEIAQKLGIITKEEAESRRPLFTLMRQYIETRKRLRAE